MYKQRRALFFFLKASNAFLLYPRNPKIVSVRPSIFAFPVKFSGEMDFTWPKNTDLVSPLHLAGKLMTFYLTTRDLQTNSVFPLNSVQIFTSGDLTTDAVSPLNLAGKWISRYFASRELYYQFIASPKFGGKNEVTWPIQQLIHGTCSFYDDSFTAKFSGEINKRGRFFFTSENDCLMSSKRI